MIRSSLYLLYLIMFLFSCQGNLKRQDHLSLNTIKIDSLFIDEESPIVLMHWNEQLASGLFTVSQKDLSYRYNSTSERTFTYNILGDTPDQLKGSILISMVYLDDSSTFVEGVLSTNIYNAAGELIDEHIDINYGIRKSLAFPAFSIGENIYRSDMSSSQQNIGEYALWKFDIKNKTYEPYLKFPEEVTALKDEKFYYTFKRVGEMYWLFIPGLPHIYIYEVVGDEIHFKKRYDNVILQLSDLLGADMIALEVKAENIVPLGDQVYVGYKAWKDRKIAKEPKNFGGFIEENYLRAYFLLKDGEIVAVGKGDHFREKYRNLYPLSDGSFWGIERNIDQEDPDLQNKYYRLRFEME
ncbi:MAG: hypothetical protein LAT68_08165 [Cyclobacteriaceae bacterium]|nr:hypothetical protein [Cyclobacteriaceae bacterium]MCH8516289.1 hypothetical protein [Cyclobacteriaceae bacterium]